jgi:hypothetical protein
VPLHLSQLNIFLAILIEGYTKVKESVADSKGILEEFYGVLSHEVNRLLQLVFWDRGPTTFVSDDRLASELAAVLNTLPTTMNRAIKDYASVALGNVLEVLCMSCLS